MKEDYEGVPIKKIAPEKVDDVPNSKPKKSWPADIEDRIKFDERIRKLKDERKEVKHEIYMRCIDRKKSVYKNEIKYDDIDNELVVDEKGRRCYADLSGLAIPRYLRDEYMERFGRDEVVWYTEDTNDILHNDLAEKLKSFKKDEVPF